MNKTYELLDDNEFRLAEGAVLTNNKISCNKFNIDKLDDIQAILL